MTKNQIEQKCAMFKRLHGEEERTCDKDHDMLTKLAGDCVCSYQCQDGMNAVITWLVKLENKTAE